MKCFRALLSALILAQPAPVASAAADAPQFLLNLKTRIPIAHVDPRFLSFALDTAQVTGGKWWDSSMSSSGGRGSHTVPPFDFSPRRLERLAAALSPAYLRVGGSEADLAYYDLSPSGDAPLPHGFESRLTRARYDALYGFTQAAGLSLFFDLNAGEGNRARGEWDPANMMELVDYARASRQLPAAWELGNEVNAFWLVQGLTHQISSAHYARDYVTARTRIQAGIPDARLAGPASAYWPWLGEPLGFLFGEMEGFLREAPRGSVDTVTWHYYPTEGRRCGLAVRRASAAELLKPGTLNEIRKWAAKVAALRDRYQPQAELWLGESGSAQCGGEPGASDTFASSFWWLDELGTLAKLGHSVVIRQTLTGSEYGMIHDGDWEPRPDYWASLLWKKLMGSTVLDAGAPDDGSGMLRAYAHCAGPGFPAGAVSVLLLNLDAQAPATVDLGAGGRWLEYAVTAEEGGLAAARVRLGGQTLSAGPGGELPDLEGEAHEGPVRATLAPQSYSFVVLSDAHAEACL